MLDRVEPLFVAGGRFERYHALFEMVDTLFYSPPDVSRGSPHVRDALDLKRRGNPLRIGWHVEHRIPGKYRHAGFGRKRY
jgi:hypothetical protein